MQETHVKLSGTETHPKWLVASLPFNMSVLLMGTAVSTNLSAKQPRFASLMT